MTTPPRKPFGIFIKFTIAAVALWFLYLGATTLLFKARTPGENPWPVRGQFGDTFGAMTCLFSAMTLVGLIATIIHQGDQTQQQQDAQRKTDEALARQAESLALSAAINVVHHRLTRYDVQLNDLAGGTRDDEIPLREGGTMHRGDLIDRLKMERHNLTKQLDALLQKAIAS
jgi:hypothetical protein